MGTTGHHCTDDDILARFWQDFGYILATLITADGAYHCPVGSIWPFLLYKILKYFGPRPIDCATLATLILLINVIHHHTSQLIWALLSEQVRRKNERLTDYFGIAPPKHVSSNHGFTEYKGAQSVGKDSCSLPCYCSVWFGLFVFVVFFLWTICLCTICFCTVCLCTVCFCTVYFCLVCLCSVCFVFLLFVSFTLCLCTVSHINCYESKNLQTEVVGTRKG